MNNYKYLNFNDNNFNLVIFLKLDPNIAKSSMSVKLKLRIKVSSYKLGMFSENVSIPFSFV